MENASPKIKLIFTTNELINYAYKHAPVESMNGRPPLEEIISSQPLNNFYSDNILNPETYYLTYIYYKTKDLNGNNIITGYGYLTVDVSKPLSVRSVFTITNLSAQILSSKLFGLPPLKLDNFSHQENVKLYNNETGETANLIFTINQIDDNYVITIETSPEC